jgi:hypothetical protein
VKDKTEVETKVKVRTDPKNRRSQGDVHSPGRTGFPLLRPDPMDRPLDGFFGKTYPVFSRIADDKLKQHSW